VQLLRYCCGCGGAAPAEVKKWTYGCPPHFKADEHKKKRSEDKLARLDGEIKKLNEKIKKGRQLESMSRVCGAFVVFQDTESADRALSDYRLSNRRLLRLFQPKDLCFRHSDGRLYPLRVVRAPEPSDLLWEALETSDMARGLRRAATFGITLLLLIVSFVVIYQAQVMNGTLHGYK
jgi:hypothetical protein